MIISKKLNKKEPRKYILQLLMLHTRTEPSENERHHDQAEEDKWNIKFLDYL